MTTNKSTKRALFLSMMSLILCAAMLIGTTYAWFTESVSSVNNIITGGNLDVELYWSTDAENWTAVGANTNIFKKDTLWEPGHTEVVYLKVVNEGTLSLKYQLGVNVYDEVIGKTAEGKDIKLSEHIEFGVVTGGKVYKNNERAQAIADAQATAMPLKAGYTKASKLFPKVDNPVAGEPSEETVALVVYMPETVGNEANYVGDAIPEINLGITLFATQYTWEKDSFDEYYDQDTAVFTVEDANKMMKEGKDTTLVNCIDPQGVLEVPAGYTGTLTVVNSTVKSVQGAGDVNLVILGDVTVNAKPAAATFAATSFDGSAITAKGKLSISGEGNLTAIAADVTGAFGIGGMTTTEISIKDITIDYASGSSVQPDFKNDTKYGKSEPEGGAAIGSGYNGANIALDNVTVLEAHGGSKAAAIGARYWTGVTINITDSTIVNAFGGNASAGIGGSRVSKGATENEKITINITNSTVTAKGGAYGAGIGSGYDTHCNDSQPLCTINIEGSTINATGGKYAAGVGTGYHNAALAGEIKKSAVTAASGEKWYKDTYTSAMDIGFGVTDPTREGKQTDSYIIYNGEKIYCNAVSVSDAESLKDALAEGKNVVLAGDVETEAATTAPYGNKYAFKQDGGVIDGNGNELYMECYGDDYGIMTSGGTIKNIVIKEACRAIMIMYPTADIILDNVNIGGAGVLYPINTGEAGAEGVDLIVTNSTLAGWTSYSNIQSASFTNVEFKQGTYYNNIYGRVLKPYVNTTLTDCSFVKHMNLDLSGLANGQKVTITNCTVNGQKVTADVFTVPSTDAEYDTELFTVDLPSWTTSINDCIVFG